MMAGGSWAVKRCGDHRSKSDSGRCLSRSWRARVGLRYVGCCSAGAEETTKKTAVAVAVVGGAQGHAGNVVMAVLCACLEHGPARRGCPGGGVAPVAAIAAVAAAVDGDEQQCMLRVRYGPCSLVWKAHKVNLNMAVRPSSAKGAKRQAVMAVS